MFRNAHLVLRLELAIPSLLGDTEEQATKRRIDAEHAMRRLFRYAVAVFGQEDASRIWTNVAKNPRGPRKGSRDPQRDRLILAFYDEGIRDCRSGAAIRRWPRRVGLWLAAADPGRYGASAEAITKHVRRLVRERDEHRREEEERMRMVFGNTRPVSLLSSLISTKPGASLSEGQEFPPL